MTRKALGHLAYLLLDPAPAAGGGGAPAPGERTVLGSNAADLAATTQNALAAELGIDPKLFGGSPSAAATPPAAPTAATPAATPAAAAPPAAATPSAAAPAAAAPATPAPVELTAEQKDWLTKRAAVTTEAEAQQLDAAAPAFSDEQWAEAEKTFTASAAAPVAGTPQTPDEFQAALTAVQAEATKAKADAEAASKRLQEVEAELAKAKATPPPAIPVANIHPLMHADAATLDQAEQNALAVKEWAMKNFDGAPAQGDQPEYTAVQVRTALANADRLLLSVIPAARQSLADHTSANIAAREIYPELFNPQAQPLAAEQASPFQTRELTLKRLPGLRAAIPNINVMIGDMIVGEQLRTVLASQVASADVHAARNALLKAIPALGKFMPKLSNPSAGATKPGFRLPSKPVVPLARPSSGGGRSISRPGKATPPPALKQLAAVANTHAEGDVLTDIVRSQLGNIPTIDPKTDA